MTGVTDTGVLNSPTEQVGFVGLGKMGLPIANHLFARAPLVVCDLDPARTAELEAEGARVAHSPRAVADAARIVFCCLPTPQSVEMTLLGPEGVIEGGKVRIVVDLSTTGPQVIRRAEGRLAERGIALVDAPVSGGVPGATAGTLTLMLAGEPAAIAAIEPLLRLFGRNLFRIGPSPGQGQQMKLVNNLLISACALASFEVLVMGAKAGLDARTMLNVINVSSGRNYITTHKIAASVLDRSFPPGFATELLLKDVALGLAEAKALGVPMDFIEEVRRFLAFAVDRGDGPSDYAVTIRHVEARAGVELRG